MSDKPLGEPALETSRAREEATEATASCGGCPHWQAAPRVVRNAAYPTAFLTGTLAALFGLAFGFKVFPSPLQFGGALFFSSSCLRWFGCAMPSNGSKNWPGMFR